MAAHVVPNAESTPAPPERDSRSRWILRGDSAATVRLGEQIGRVASTPATTVLVVGEPGVRKDLVARLIHLASARSSWGLLQFACDSIDDLELERTLRARSGGERTLASTLVLEEVACLGERSQGALLARLDGAGDGPRIVATTARDLEALARAGSFRDDLLYRLNVLRVQVPSLRVRAADVPVLAADRLARAQARLGRRCTGLSRVALEGLRAHAWPGNLRELESVVELAALQVRDGPVRPEHLRLGDAPPAGSPTSSTRDLRSAEEELVRRVLTESAGNKSRAARVLGIHRATLYHKLEGYGLA
jgi:DNA-binding NtrC family response regulator